MEFTGDGAKMIWVRARDDAGNRSEIVHVNCVLDTTAPASLAVAGQTEGVTNSLSRIWLLQIDLAGNASGTQAFDLQSPNLVAHEASGNPFQPSILFPGLHAYLINGVVSRGDADYVTWDIPKGQKVLLVKLVHDVSEEEIAFYALQRNKVFDAGIDVSRMLVYGHMGPSDLGRNVLANVPKTELGEGAMTLWFQQTGPLPTHYAIEVVLAPAD